MINLCVKNLEDINFFKPKEKETNNDTEFKKYFFKDGAI